MKMHLAPLVEAVGNGQRIAPHRGGTRGARAGVLTDGAAPLQLDLGQMALPAGAGEYSLVESAQRQVDDRCQIGVIAALKVLEGFVGKREGGQQTQRACQAGASVGERLQDGSDLV